MPPRQTNTSEDLHGSTVAIALLRASNALVPSPPLKSAAPPEALEVEDVSEDVLEESESQDVATIELDEPLVIELDEPLVIELDEAPVIELDEKPKEEETGTAKAKAAPR